MASSQDVIDFIVGQLQAAGIVTSRRMFGDYALYVNGKVVGFVCDDQLFIKPTAGGKAYIGNPELAPPYSGAKDYFVITEDYWDDSDWLTGLVTITAREVPLPKKKRITGV